MKYCQGPKCHEYKTKDRIRGHKGDKHYETRKRVSFYYLGGNACSIKCERDWFNTFGALALKHFGVIHEPKRQDASGAWYKYRNWRGYNNPDYYFVNDLLGDKIAISQAQYNDRNYTAPYFSSATKD